MNIREVRSRVPDVMAIYLVAPTEENFKIIENDLNQNIFDNFYLNFIDKVDDYIFQNFFSNLINTNRYQRIYRISVHPIDFLMFHPKLFTLNIENSYQFLNLPGIQENEINNYYNKIGKGLYNLLYTLKTIPVIKYRQNWFAENIIKVVQDNFNYLFDKFPEIKEEFPRKNNALLIILDRDTDIPIMLHHAGSLGSMVNDLFGISRKKNDKKFEIDPHVDYIWNTYLTTDYPTAHGKISEDLKGIIEKTDFLNNSNSKSEDIEKVSEQINSTLDNIRDITIRQTVLKNHANSAEKLSNEIKTRFLDKFYDLEFTILSNRKSSKETYKKLVDILGLKSTNTNYKNDCLRLILIYYLIQNKASNEELNNIENLFNEYGINKNSFEYLKQKKSFEESMKKDNNSNSINEGGNSFFNYFANKSKNLIKGVSSLMSSEQPSTVADIVNNLSSKKNVNSFSSYNLLKKSIDDNINNNFEQVIVFMVGGGSLAEFEYIDQLLMQNHKNVYYFI